MLSPVRKMAPSAMEKAFRACRGAFFSAAFFSFFINLLMLTGPLFMLQVYDRVLTSGSMPTLVVLFALVAVLFAFMGFLEFIRSRILVRISARLDESVKADVFDAMITHELRKTAGVKTGPVRDLGLVRSFIAGPGPAALFDMPWAPFYIAVNFLFHWILGVFSLMAAALLAGLSIANELLSRRPVSMAAMAANKVSGLTEEARHNAEVLKAMGMLARFRARWMGEDAIARSFQMQASDRGGLITALTKSARMLLQSAVLAVGAALAIAQEISPGTMVAASIILSRALAPLEQSIGQWRNLLGARKAYQRLKLVTAGQGAVAGQEKAARMALPEPRGALAAERITVAAPGSEVMLLQGLDFALEPGTGLGVIGESGAGKSTLLRVLAGVQQAGRGTVRLDGAELDHYPGASLGRLIGYLPQNVALFEATVKENIARLAPDPNPAAVVGAARLAHVHELIQNLPEGYNTPLGGSGMALSAGQQQRIALARAFYGNPVLVVLDEPNAHLDAEGEAALVKAIRNLRSRGATVVVAAHRPSVLAAVDRILVLKEGRMAAFGPREQVLAQATMQPAAPGAMARHRTGTANGGAFSHGLVSPGMAQKEVRS